MLRVAHQSLHVKLNLGLLQKPCLWSSKTPSNAGKMDELESSPPDDDPVLFDVLTPLGFRVHCYQSYWLRKVVEVHPVMEGREDDVAFTLSTPDEIRLSSKDDGIYLFYSVNLKRYTCAVARKDGDDGFLITAYPTDKMKKGAVVWTK
jgi:hypothetical protein